ncbi:MAG: dephospho-CoA kinase [Bacteroidetes bacterium]|jgi:dephospho-CoA kinase|nr:dephospho-CoA kinase [Bacteroidota bacterium]
MKTIGITGGIGSGKSTVCRQLAGMGYPVFHSDAESKRLLNEDPQARAEVLEAFGQQAYSDGQLNRAWLARQVFADPAALQVLNRIAHPAVGRAFRAWQAAHAASPLGFKEAAILYEAGVAAELDAVVVVSCPLEERIRRVMARDQVGREEVLARMERQWPEERKLALADYVIVNDGTQPLQPQLDQLIAALHQQPPLIDG